MPTRSCFKLIVVLLLAIPLHGLSQVDSTAVDAPSPDTVSADTMDSDDCLDRFFVDPIHPDTKTFLVLPKGKVMTTAAFKKANDDEEYMKIGLADIDHDGKKELLIYNYTGGAHCCDELYFFNKIGTNRYHLAAKTFGGDMCADDDNTFNYFFDQHFGYFFTCFACGIEDTTAGGIQPVHSIQLRFKQGKLNIVPGSPALRNIIVNNLEKLEKMAYQPIDPDLGQDDGTRKEFAMNLAVYYYSFGQQLAATHQLFNRYYNFPDKAAVWLEFSKTLQGVREDNIF